MSLRFVASQNEPFEYNAITNVGKRCEKKFNADWIPDAKSVLGFPTSNISRYASKRKKNGKEESVVQLPLQPLLIFTNAVHWRRADALIRNGFAIGTPWKTGIPFGSSTQYFQFLQCVNAKKIMRFEDQKGLQAPASLPIKTAQFRQRRMKCVRCKNKCQRKKRNQKQTGLNRHFFQKKESIGLNGSKNNN